MEKIKEILLKYDKYKCLSEEQLSDIVPAMEEYGKFMYNEALEEAIKNVRTKCSIESDEWGMNTAWHHKIDNTSILKLKK